MSQRIKLALPALMMALGASGCENLLVEEPESFLTTDTYYQSAADLETAMLGAYQSARTYDWQVTETQASDQGRHDPGETGSGNILPDYVVWDASTPNGTTGEWNPSYQLIYRANLIIERAPGIDMTEGVRAGYVAEAKFLRAFAYLQLMKRYSAGNKPSDPGVPLLLTEADHGNREPVRAAQSEVFAQIIKDLTESELALPATRTGAAVGRATKGAAQMALADTYLWRSSFMVSNEWQQASDWAKKVVDATSIYGLNTSYFNTFSPANKANNREMIFKIVAAGDRANTAVVNTFYPRQLGFAGSPGGGFGLLKPTRWMLASYARGDIRGSVGPQGDTVAYRTTACFTDASRGCPTLVQGVEPGYTNVPHVWKFRPSSTNNGLGDVDQPIYRYAEALLYYAEAQNEIGNTATAIQYVNMIRARARRGVSGNESRVQPADLPATLTKQQARDAIYMERNWELAFEKGDRWFDLVRRNSLEPGYWKAALLANNPETAGAREPLQEYRMRFPLPATEVVLVPSLVQNPGY